MGERALVLSADVWSMPDERTGEIRNGVSVWYMNEYREDTDKSFGYKPTKVSAAPEMLDILRAAKLPAICDLDFGSRPGKEGKATLTLVGMKAVKNVELFDKAAAVK